MAFMKNKFCYNLIVLLLVFAFCSCDNIRKENKEVLIAQLIDSLNVSTAKHDGEQMLVLLDSIKSLG